MKRMRGAAGSAKPRYTRGDVAEAEEPPVRADRDLADLLDRVEGAARAQVDAVAGGLEEAGRRDRVLRSQGLLTTVCSVDAERGELGVGELDPDLLVLQADQVDLGDVRHALQLLPDALGVVLQSRVVKPSPVSA